MYLCTKFDAFVQICTFIPLTALTKCRNKGIEDGRRYAATNASQLTQLKGGKAARRCLLHVGHVGLHRQILIDENAEITDCCRR